MSKPLIHSLVLQYSIADQYMAPICQRQSPITAPGKRRATHPLVTVPSALFVLHPHLLADAASMLAALCVVRCLRPLASFISLTDLVCLLAFSPTTVQPRRRGRLTCLIIRHSC